MEDVLKVKLTDLGLTDAQLTALNLEGVTNEASIALLSADEIKAIREAQHVSQPVFARYLNVSKNLVSDWERGKKRPGGPALRLLSIIQRKGLEAIA